MSDSKIYTRDDGAVMIEIQPGHYVAILIAERLGLLRR